MKTKYLCPHCLTILNIEEDVILVAKKKSGQKGMVILHAALGNYDSRKSPDFKVDDHEEVDFFCPACAKSLEYPLKIHLVNLIMIDEHQKESNIVFSKVYKEHCTYHIIDKDVYTYGECAKRFSNPDWFL